MTEHTGIAAIVEKPPGAPVDPPFNVTLASLPDGSVRIDFGKQVTWIGLPAKDAIGFASLIIKHAIDAAKVANIVLPIDIMELPIKTVEQT